MTRSFLGNYSRTFFKKNVAVRTEEFTPPNKKASHKLIISTTMAVCLKIIRMLANRKHMRELTRKILDAMIQRA